MKKYVVEAVDEYAVTREIASYSDREKAERLAKAITEYHKSINQPVNIRVREVEEPAIPMDIIVFSTIVLVALLPAIIALWGGLNGLMRGKM